MFTEYSTGQMNKIVMALGMEPFKWLKVGWTGMAALLVLACWRWTGVNMLYFLSGLKSIDTSLYEAAEIDGANGWQKFRYVTLPLLRPTTIYVLTIPRLYRYPTMVSPMFFGELLPAHSMYDSRNIASPA